MAVPSYAGVSPADRRGRGGFGLRNGILFSRNPPAFFGLESGAIFCVEVVIMLAKVSTRHRSYEPGSCVDAGGDVRPTLKYDGKIVCIPLADYQSLKEKAERAVDAERRLHTAQQIRDIAVKRSREVMAEQADIANYNTYSWYEQHKGAKAGCGRLADAMILANAVRGLSLEAIQKLPYPYKKGASKVYGQRKIFSALSVKQEGDLQRIDSLLTDFPDVFSDLSPQDVWAWVDRKRRKGCKV